MICSGPSVLCGLYRFSWRHRFLSFVLHSISNQTQSSTAPDAQPVAFDSGSSTDVYDPCFVLHVFHHYLTLCKFLLSLNLNRRFTAFFSCLAVVILMNKTSITVILKCFPDVSVNSFGLDDFWTLIVTSNSKTWHFLCSYGFWLLLMPLLSLLFLTDRTSLSSTVEVVLPAQSDQYLRTFYSHNCLSYCLAALSSYSKHVRSMARSLIADYRDLAEQWRPPHVVKETGGQTNLALQLFPERLKVIPKCSPRWFSLTNIFWFVCSPRLWPPVVAKRLGTSISVIW